MLGYKGGTFITGAVAVHPQLNNDKRFPMDVALAVMDVDDSHKIQLVQS
jgi:hypothetical protein